MSVNKVFLLGHIGSDPEVRYPQKDNPIVFASLATNELIGASRTETTEWHYLVFTGQNAVMAEKYVRKGSQLFIEGKLRSREYEDRMKITRRRTEIIVERFEILGRK